MLYTKPMIELVFQIRRLCPSELKPIIKLANPNLFGELQSLYQGNNCAACKKLITEFFSLVETPLGESAKSGFSYPGQNFFESVTAKSAPNSPEAAAATLKKSRKRVYRGQVIEG